MTAGVPPSPISGLLVIDKPLDLTSMTVCRAVKRRLIAGGQPKSVKVGHGGTLDPLATGIVVVLIGRATKLCDTVMAGEKRYLADVDLLRTSDTHDREGDIREAIGVTPPTREQVLAALPAFIGAIQQTPPAHSAIWVDGARAYHIARAGEDPGLKPRTVHIHSIDLVDYAWPIARLDIRCGKGTYIRSLARDLGRALGGSGGGGMLAALRRTQVGPFTIDRAIPLDNLPERLTPADLLDPAPFIPS